MTTQTQNRKQSASPLPLLPQDSELLVVPPLEESSVAVSTLDYDRRLSDIGEHFLILCGGHRQTGLIRDRESKP